MNRSKTTSEALDELHVAVETFKREVVKALRKTWLFNRRRGDRRIHPTGFHNDGRWGHRRTGLDDRREWFT